VQESSASGPQSGKAPYHSLIYISTYRWVHFKIDWQVVHGDPPQLTAVNSASPNGNKFTMDFINFVNLCLMKEGFYYATKSVGLIFHFCLYFIIVALGWIIQVNICSNFITNSYLEMSA
jgi:hypothetical protein